MWNRSPARPRLAAPYLFATCLWVGLPWPAAPLFADLAPEDELIVFVQPGSTQVAERFSSEHLPRIREAAQRLGLPVRLVDASEGAPAEVRITPLIVFQNARGRSIFQGRYTDVGKLVHFVRTSRAVPLESFTQRRREISVLERGRSVTAFPIKVTELAGEPPPGFDPEAFRTRAEETIAGAFLRLARRHEVELGPSNRLFYLDFHPHRSTGGVLSVTTAIYSQFSCIVPVFERLDDPVQGRFEQAERVFAEAASVLEAEVLRQIATSAIGDGFDPVASSVPSPSWHDLGLALPPAADRQDAAALTQVDLPRRWRIEEAKDGAPRLIFRFPAPLERYSGEVTELRGELHLAEDDSLRDASGWIEVETASVTMGEEMLDQEIHGKMIRVGAFPTARFDLAELADATPPLAFGRPSLFVAGGTFILLGLPIPVEVRGEIEPVIGEDGAPRLRVSASYRIRLSDPFEIAGPDGPAPANDTLVFYLDFLMTGEPPGSRP